MVRTPAVPAASAKSSAAVRMSFFMAISRKDYELTMQFCAQSSSEDVMAITFTKRAVTFRTPG